MAIKQQLPLFLLSHPPQLHVCPEWKERKEFLLWFIRWTWFWPKVLLLLEACHHPIHLSASTWKWPDNTFFNAAFGSFWAARAFKWTNVLSGLWVNMLRIHVPVASFIKSQQTGQTGEFMRSLFSGLESWQTLQTVWFQSISRGRPCSASCNAKSSWWRFTEGGEYSIVPPSLPPVLYLRQSHDKTSQWALAKCLSVSCVVVGGDGGKQERKFRNK